MTSKIEESYVNMGDDDVLSHFAAQNEELDRVPYRASSPLSTTKELKWLLNNFGSACNCHVWLSIDFLENPSRYDIEQFECTCGLAKQLQVLFAVRNQTSRQGQRESKSPEKTVSRSSSDIMLRSNLDFSTSKSLVGKMTSPYLQKLVNEESSKRPIYLTKEKNTASPTTFGDSILIDEITEANENVNKRLKNVLRQKSRMLWEDGDRLLDKFNNIDSIYHGMKNCGPKSSRKKFNILQFTNSSKEDKRNQLSSFERNDLVLKTPVNLQSKGGPIGLIDDFELNNFDSIGDPFKQKGGRDLSSILPPWQTSTKNRTFDDIKRHQDEEIQKKVLEQNLYLCSRTIVDPLRKAKTSAIPLMYSSLDSFHVEPVLHSLKNPPKIAFEEVHQLNGNEYKIDVDGMNRMISLKLKRDISEQYRNRFDNSMKVLGDPLAVNLESYEYQNLQNEYENVVAMTEDGLYGGGNDPLYRITQEESEESVKQKLLADRNLILHDEGKITAIKIIRSSAIKNFGNFSNLSPEIWVVARLTYLLIFLYYELVVIPEQRRIEELEKNQKNAANLGIIERRRSMIFSTKPIVQTTTSLNKLLKLEEAKASGFVANTKTKKAESMKNVDANKMNGKKYTEGKLSNVKIVDDENYLRYLLEHKSLDMKSLWEILASQESEFIELMEQQSEYDMYEYSNRNDDFIVKFSWSVLRNFTWPKLQKLLTKSREISLLFYLMEHSDFQIVEYDLTHEDDIENVEKIRQSIEHRKAILRRSQSFQDTTSLTAGSLIQKEDDDMINEFYLLLPHLILPILRTAVRKGMLYPKRIAHTSEAASFICRWNRRILAGIYRAKMRERNLNIPAVLSGKISLPTPLADTRFTKRRQFNKQKLPPLCNEISVDDRSPAVVDAAMASFAGIRKHKNDVSTTTVTLVVAAFDIFQSERSISRYVLDDTIAIALLLARPIDRLDILVHEVMDSPQSNAGLPSQQRLLPSGKNFNAVIDYCRIYVSSISNSPTHRVINLSDYGTINHDIDSDKSKLTASFSLTGIASEGDNGESTQEKDIRRQSTVTSKSNLFERFEQLQKPTQWANSRKMIDENRYDTLAGLLDYSFRRDVKADILVIGLPQTLHPAAISQADIFSRQNELILKRIFSKRTGSLALVIACSGIPRTPSSSHTMAHQSKSPNNLVDISAPSRFIVCVKDSPNSRNAFKLAQTLCKTGDQLLLLHIAFTDKSVDSNDDSVADEGETRARLLVNRYLQLGYNLHVVRMSKHVEVGVQLDSSLPFFAPSIPSLMAHERRRHLAHAILIYADGQSALESNFRVGATFIVLGADDNDLVNTMDLISSKVNNNYESVNLSRIGSSSENRKPRSRDESQMIFSRNETADEIFFLESKEEMTHGKSNIGSYIHCKDEDFFDEEEADLAFDRELAILADICVSNNQMRRVDECDYEDERFMSISAKKAAAEYASSASNVHRRSVIETVLAAACDSSNRALKGPCGRAIDRFSFVLASSTSSEHFS